MILRKPQAARTQYTGVPERGADMASEGGELFRVISVLARNTIASSPSAVHRGGDVNTLRNPCRIVKQGEDHDMWRAHPDHDCSDPSEMPMTIKKGATEMTLWGTLSSMPSSLGTIRQIATTR